MIIKWNEAKNENIEHNKTSIQESFEPDLIYY